MAIQPKGGGDPIWRGKGSAADPKKRRDKTAATAKASSGVGRKINTALPASAIELEARGRGRPRGEPVMPILVSVPKAWLDRLDAEVARRGLPSRPMTIRAVLAEALLERGLK